MPLHFSLNLRCFSGSPSNAAMNEQDHPQCHPPQSKSKYKTTRCASSVEHHVQSCQHGSLSKPTHSLVTRVSVVVVRDVLLSTACRAASDVHSQLATINWFHWIRDSRFPIPKTDWSAFSERIGVAGAARIGLGGQLNDTGYDPHVGHRHGW